MWEAVFQLITMTTQSWTPVSARRIGGTPIFGFRDIRVSVASANACTTAGLGYADAGVVRDKDATTGGKVWGPPV
jgi:hypothetical protein